MELKNNKGFTGVDIAVSTVILIVFISLITTMFYNLSVTYKKIERKTIATYLAIQTIEAMKIINFENLTETITINEINNLIENKIKIPNGYDIHVGVDNTKYPDVIKIISAQVNYKSGKNTEDVKIETLVKNEIQTIIPKGIYVSLNGNTLSFFDNETAARANADSEAHYYGNIAEKLYDVTWAQEDGTEVNTPWFKDRASIRQISIEDEIFPVITRGWFATCSNVQTIENIQNLKTEKVTDMSNMFRDCNNLQTLNVKMFDTSNVTKMNSMFMGCTKLNSLDVSSFNTNKVTNMSAMFRECTNLTSLDLSNFDTSNVTDISNMFANYTSNETKLTQIKGIGNFNTSKITNMYAVFYACKNLETIDVSKWNTSNVTNMWDLFNGCSSLTNLDVKNFNTSNVTNMRGMFAGCSRLETLDLSNFDTGKVTNMRAMFFCPEEISKMKEIKGIENFNTSKVIDMSYMFWNCQNLKTLDVSKYNTSNVTDIYGMFYYCSLITKFDLTKWDTRKVTDMGDLFDGCINLAELNLSSFNTSNVTSMYRMFANCFKLTTIDISSFNTNKVTNMVEMFANNYVKTIYVGSGWNDTKATKTDMFIGCGTNTVTYK